MDRTIQDDFERQGPVGRTARSPDVPPLDGDSLAAASIAKALPSDLKRAFAGDGDFYVTRFALDSKQRDVLVQLLVALAEYLPAGWEWMVPVLVAMAYQESNFDLTARGKLGELGLFQFLPDTWAYVGDKVEGSWKHIDSQVRAVLKYIRGTASQLGLDVSQANSFVSIVMAHNAGAAHSWDYQLGLPTADVTAKALGKGKSPHKEVRAYLNASIYAQGIVSKLTKLGYTA